MATAESSADGVGEGRRLRVGIALATAVLLGSLVAVAVVLSQAQSDSRQSAMERFSAKAELSAAMTQSVFTALGNASGEDLQRRFGGSRSEVSRALAVQFRETHVPYMAVVDARRRVIATAGRPPVRLGVVSGRQPGPLLSNVMRSGKVRYIQYAIPFGPPGERRVLAQGVPMEIMAPFFDEYLARVRQVDGVGLALTDKHGEVITRKGKITLRGTAEQGRVGADAAVPGTPWTLRLEADRSSVMAAAGGVHTLPWLILAALALSAAAGIGLYARLALAARRQREANGALHESREQLSSLVDALEEAVFLHHADGRSELLNASAKELLDTERDAMEGLDPGWTLLDADGMPMDREEAPVRRALATGAPCSQVVGIERPDGTPRWLSVRARPLIRPGERKPHAVVASCTDVTEQRDMELHLTDLAHRDPLTGLWNRRRFQDDLSKQLARCERYEETAAVMVLDLDGFKQVNDTFGHLVGDEVLCALGDGLNRRLRASDTAARIGGDEFAVLLVNVDREEAHRVARDVAARLTEFAREEINAHLELTLSVGVTILDPRLGDVTRVLAAADHAMYADKRRPGRTTSAGGGPGTLSVKDLGSRDARFSSLRALLTAVQARDSYTAVHSRQVVALARAVARRLQLDDTQVDEVESAALLHDLGKIAVPDAILRKRGPLSEHEQLLMREHPVVGEQMVSSIPDLEHLGPAIRAEHERWDGTGYPDGLAGERIPLSSRIAFVCDAYHAMTSDRPYRRALSHEAAMAEIEVEAGSQFCPAAARALLEVLRAESQDGNEPLEAGAAA